MRKDIFESEEEAREIFNFYCGFEETDHRISLTTVKYITGKDLDTAIEKMKYAGLIKKSELEKKKENYWKSAEGRGCIVSNVEATAHYYILELEKELEKNKI